MVILLINNSLQKDPDARPDIDQLLNDGWLSWFVHDDLSFQNWLQENF
jgi:hypothetical protein